MSERRARGERRGAELVVAVIGALALALIYGPLMDPLRFPNTKDSWQFYAAQRAYSSEGLDEPGRLLWDPRVDAGRPVLADPTQQALYPGQLLFFTLPLTWAWKAFVALHVGLAVWAMRRFALSLGAGACSSAFAGFAYAACGPVMSHSWSLIWLVGLAFAPLLWRAAFARRGGSLGLSATVAVLLLGGAAEVLYGGIVMTAAFGLWRLVSEAEERWAAFRDVLSLAAFYLLGASLAAVQLVPTLELVALSDRASALSGGDSTLWALAPARLPELFAPSLFGDAHTSLRWLSAYSTVEQRSPFLSSVYVGAGTLALAALGALAGDARDRRALSLAVLTCLLLSLGHVTPLHALLNAGLPGFGSFRYCEKILSFGMVPLAALSALGFDAWRRAAPSRASPALLVASGALALQVALALLAWRFPSSLEEPIAAILHESAGVTAAALVSWMQAALVVGAAPTLGLVLLCALAWLWPRGKPAVIVLAMAVLLLDLGNANSRHLNMGRLAVLAERPAPLPAPTKPAARIATRAPTPWVAIVPQQAAWLGYDSVDGYGSMRIACRARFDSAFDPASDERRLRICGVGYALTAPRDNFDPTRMFVDRLDDPRRIRFVEAAIRAPTPELAGRLAAPSFDPERAVLLPGLIGESAALASEPGAVEWLAIERGPTFERVRLSVARPGYIVIAATSYPGWVATVDGEPARLEVANLCFRAVAVDAGEHELELSYRPLSVLLGALISALTAAGLGVGLWRNSRREGGVQASLEDSLVDAEGRHG